MMHQRKWLRAAFMVSGLAVALAAQDATQAPAPQEYQPGQVIQVPPHFNPKWDYPKEITLPEGTELHIVERGDTLWDLGNKYLGNPFAWPQIWEMNQWITDPHWIYPGDHLIIPTGRTSIKPGETPTEVSNLQPGGSKFQSKPLRDEYAFTFQDFLQLPYLAPNGAPELYKQLGGLRVSSVGRSVEPNKGGEGDFETLYVDGGSDQGLKVGDRLLALKLVKKKLYHPLDKRESTPLGDVVKQVAVGRVTQIQPNASVVVVEKAADTVEVGDQLVPFAEPANMMLKLRTDTKEPIPVQSPEARVIYTGHGNPGALTSMLLIIDKGSVDGMKVGDVLLAVREKTWPTGTPQSKQKAKTNYLVAQLMVVKTIEGSSTCRVLRAYEEVLPGDIVTH